MVVVLSFNIWWASSSEMAVHLNYIPTAIRRGEPLARLKTNNHKKLTLQYTFNIAKIIMKTYIILLLLSLFIILFIITNCSKKDDSITPPSDTTAPNIPTGLTAITGNNKVILSWTANIDEDLAKYIIYISQNPDDNNPSKNSESTTNSKTVDSLLNDTTYYFWITAMDYDNNESNRSSRAEAKPAPDTTAPNIPTGLTATADNQKVILNWTANSEIDLAKYIIYISQNPDDANPSKDSESTTNSKTIDSLTNDITYYFWITAMDNEDNESARSSRAEAKPTLTALNPIMVEVQGGTFTMGDWLEAFELPDPYTEADNNKDIYSQHGRDYTFDARVTHNITLNTFYIAKTEITFDEFDTFCEDIGRELNPDEGWGRGTRPAIHISWLDAIEYANWLSEQNGYEKCYNIISDTNVECNFNTDGYRLPTEAEWEYAIKGGHLLNTDVNGGYGCIYSGADDYYSADDYFKDHSTLKQYAYFAQNSGWTAAGDGSTFPVAQKSANELGLHDMAGNVWEWCWDWYHPDYYAISPSDNPKGPDLEDAYKSRVLRGGSWGNGSIFLRSTFRFFSPNQHYTGNMDYTNWRLGFRLCRSE